MGIVTGFDQDDDPRVKWATDGGGFYFDHQLCDAGWSDFEERIKDRLE